MHRVVQSVFPAYFTFSLCFPRLFHVNGKHLEFRTRHEVPAVEEDQRIVKGQEEVRKETHQSLFLREKTVKQDAQSKKSVFLFYISC